MIPLPGLNNGISERDGWGRGEEDGKEVVGQLAVGECLGGRISQVIPTCS